MVPSAYKASDGRIKYVIPDTMMRCAVCHGSVGPGTNWVNLAASPNQIGIAPQSQIEAIKAMNGEPSDAELSTMPDLAFKFGPRFFASIQLAGSVAEGAVGVAGILTPDPTGITKGLGFVALSHATDGALAASSTLWSGEPQATLIAQGATGMRVGRPGVEGDCRIEVGTSLLQFPFSQQQPAASRIHLRQAVTLERVVGRLLDFPIERFEQLFSGRRNVVIRHAC
jgi:hypothetical protein